MNGPQDWNLVNHNNTLPHTCCPDTPDDGTCTLNSPNIYTASCFSKLKDGFTKYGSIIGGVGIGIAVCQVTSVERPFCVLSSLFQLMGVVFACCLARSIRQEYETV